MKYLAIIAIVFLTACGGAEQVPEVVKTIKVVEVIEVPEVIEKVAELVVDSEFCPDYILTGQSNSTRDFTHFEDITGFTLQKIGVGGLTMVQLIEDFPNNEICRDNLKGILFIHGEHDALWKKPMDEYLINLEKYRLMIADVPLYLTLVGYTTNPEKDYLFDIMRETQLNSGYSVSYTEAHRFRDWGMLDDDIHFSQDGRDLISEAFAEDIWSD